MFHIDWQQALISLPVFMLALTIHEFSHGYAAYRLGDKTAFYAGRLTFNPIKHLDPIGVLVFILSGFRFGWARPVPVDLRNVDDPKKGMLISAAAGPLSNLIQAAVFGLVFRLGGFNGYQVMSDATDLTTIGAKFLFYAIFINCILAFFNLIPVPPLDGSKILYGVLPRGQEHIAMQLERIGPMLLLVLIGSGFIFGYSIIWALIGPFVKLFVGLFSGLHL